METAVTVEGAEQDDETMDIGASYGTVIKEFESGLHRWLEKETLAGDADDFDDRELDALLLKVPLALNFLTQIEPFQEQPNLLDPFLQSLIGPLITYFTKSVDSGFTVKSQQCFKIMYYYTKIRGHKITSAPCFPPI
jgi:hypothetical protein